MNPITFQGGVHPPEYKELSETKGIQKMPLPEKVIIPFSQHIGAPANPVIKKGDRVKTGQLIGEAGGFVSSNIHSSVTGEVEDIIDVLTPVGRFSKAAVIKVEEDEWVEGILEKPEEFEGLSPEQMLDRIKQAGIVGMGGATFPTHVKLKPPPDKKIDTLIINGAECEPYLTADHRLMLEYTDELIAGIKILGKILQVENVFIGIEVNKEDAIEILTRKLNNTSIKVVPLKVKYPQGAEKNLIQAILGREVPSGGLPLDVGVVVQNTGTAKAVYDAVCFKKPLIERVVTVSGDAITSPSNLLVRVGTPLSELIKYCGGPKGEVKKVISGGPMMGISLPYIENFSVTKGTSGVLLLSEIDEHEPGVCIRCARCVDACPMRLLPEKITKLIEKGEFEQAEKYGALDCVECGSCAYICPAKIPLVHLIRFGKSKIMALKKQRKGGK